MHQHGLVDNDQNRLLCNRESESYNNHDRPESGRYGSEFAPQVEQAVNGTDGLVSPEYAPP